MSSVAIYFLNDLSCFMVKHDKKIVTEQEKPVCKHFGIIVNFMTGLPQATQ